MARRRRHKPKPDYTYRDSFPALERGDGDGYLIAYSGGADSNAIMEMALDVAGPDRVHPFIMSLLPDKLDYYAYWVEFARRRWGVTVAQIQHWSLSWYIRRGIFRRMADVSFPRVILADIEASVRLATGLTWIGYGYKSIDSLQRRGMMHRWECGISPERRVFCPLKDWADHHVEDFLQRRRLAQPLDPAFQTHGIDMSPECMHWLRQYWPDDYQRMLELFPLAVAQADRWEEYLLNGQSIPAQWTPGANDL